MLDDGPFHTTLGERETLRAGKAGRALSVCVGVLLFAEGIVELKKRVFPAGWLGKKIAGITATDRGHDIEAVRPLSERQS